MGSVNTSLQNTLIQAVGDAFDDAGGGAATLEIRASDETVLASFSLDADAFGDAASGTVSANGLPKTVSASAGGTADHARLTGLDSGGADDEIISAMTVGTSGSEEVVLDNTNINSGQDVTLNSLDLNAPSSSS